MRHRRLVAAAAFAALAVAACGGDDGAAPATTPPATTAAAPSEPTTTTAVTATTAVTDPTTTAPSPEPNDCTATEPGSELTYAVYSPAASLDPLQNSGALAGGAEMAALYDVLMRWNPDSGEWEPHAAESLTPNADFTEWTLKLREGITYSNGEPLVAQDVLDNLTRLTGPGRNGARARVERIDMANSAAPDDHTVIFKLFKPWSNLGFLFGEAGGMVVNPIVGAATDGAGMPVIGNDPTGAGAGPYIVERWAPGESPYLVLKARQDYWGGAPCIETLNFVTIPSEQAKLDALGGGEVDVVFLREPNSIAAARESGQWDELGELQSAGNVLLINEGVGNFNPIGQDVRFRRAVNAALDQRSISERAYGGDMLLQDGLIHPDSRWYTEGSPAPERGTDVAKELVDELKAEGWDGKIRLSCTNANPDAPVAYEAALEAAGMEVDATVTDTTTNIVAVVVNKDYDLACWGFSIADSSIWLQLGSNLQSTSATNRIGYQSPAFDAAIDELFAAPDDDARRAAVAEMATLFAQDVPLALIGASEDVIAFPDTVKGIMQTQMSVVMFQDATIEG